MFDRQLRLWLVCVFIATCTAASLLAMAQNPASQSRCFVGLLAGLSTFLFILRLGI